MPSGWMWWRCRRSRRRPLAPEPLVRSAMTRIELYDTTLRDGMQGEGMSLSAQEKLRVAHRLDELGIDVIEAGLSELQPQGARAVRAAGRTSVSARPARRLRDDAPPGQRRRCRPGAPGPGRVLRPGVHARGQDLGASPRQGRQGRPGGEPADDLRVGRVPTRRGQARDLRRRALLRRLRRRPGLRAALPARGRRGRGARRVVCCDTNGGTLPEAVARAIDAVVSELGVGRASGRHPLPRRRRVRGGQHARRGAARGAGRSRGRSTATASAAATPT